MATADASTIFRYKACDRNGKRSTGEIRAESLDDAQKKLREQQKIPIDIVPRGARFNFFRRTSSIKQRVAFYRAYSRTQSRSVVIDDAFPMLIKQARGNANQFSVRLPVFSGLFNRAGEHFAKTLESILVDRKHNGLLLHEAMANRPEDFTDLEVALLRAADVAGTEADVLEMIGIFLDNDRKQSRRLLLHLIYPLIIFCIAAILFSYLTIVVIPQFATLFAQFHVAMPGVMGTMLRISGILRNPIALLISAGWIGASAYFLILGIQTEKGSLLFDHFRLRLPVIGELLYKSITVRFCYVMAMLIKSSISPPAAIDIAIPVVNSPAFAAGLLKAKNDLDLGRVESFTEALEKTNLFEGLLIGAIRVGDTTGEIPKMLTSVAEDYRDDVEAIITILPNVVQTVLTLLVAGVVFGIAYGIYVPMTTLVTHIGQ